MGSQNSRRANRSMEGNDNDAQRAAPEEPEGDQDYVAILSYLLRSGQVRLIDGGRIAGDDDEDGDTDANSLGSAEDEDGEDSEDYLYRFGYRGREARAQQLPKAPETFDTKVLDESHFQLQMRTQLGHFNKQSARGSSKPGLSGGCASMLWKKEAGLLSPARNVSLGAQAQCGAAYLPNRGDQVARFKDKVFCGTHSRDGSMFLSASQDANIRLFSTRGGRLKLIKKIPARDMGWSVLDTDFSPGDSCIVYSSWSNYVHLCSVSRESDRHEALKLVPDNYDYSRSTAVFSVRFSSDGKELLAGTNNGFIFVYDMERQTCVNTINGHEDDVNSVAFEGPECNMLLSGGEDGLLKVWDRRTLCETDPQPVGMLSGHRDSLTFVDSKNDGRYVLTNSKDQSIKLWDLRVMSSSSGVQATKNAVAHQKWDYRMDMYRGNAIKPKLPGDVSLMTYYGHAVLRTLIRARFSPMHTTGQQYIYSGCGHGRVIVYDVLTGRIVRELVKQKSTVRDVSWHPFQNELLSSSWDGTICRWTYDGGVNV